MCEGIFYIGLGSQGHSPTYEQAHVGSDFLTLVSIKCKRVEDGGAASTFFVIGIHLSRLLKYIYSGRM